VEEDGVRPRDRVSEYMERGFNCAEAIVAAFSERSAAVEACLVHIATPFGAGLGRTNGLCGLVSGGVIVLGAMLGRDDPSDVEAKERAYEAAAEFLASAEAACGSILCQEILGTDLSTPEGRQKALADGLFVKRCRVASVDIAGILERLLERVGATSA
jgi:C_GCAxxG_C_C family probable redox protein